MHPALERAAKSTAKLVNEQGLPGTGFFVARRIDERRARIFLVTNKHVLGRTPELRAAARSIDVHLNVVSGSQVIGVQVQYQFQNDPAAPAWREHPNPDVDLLAFDATPLAAQVRNFDVCYIAYTDFIDVAKIAELELGFGDEVIVFGYPLGTSQSGTNLPVLKSGSIASKIGGEILDEVETPQGRRRHRTVPGFIVDGAIIPGSSGSPVLLNPVAARVLRKGVVLGPPPVYLLGVISSTQSYELSSPRGPVVSIPGLALALAASTVAEVIETFFG